MDFIWDILRFLLNFILCFSLIVIVMILRDFFIERPKVKCNIYYQNIGFVKISFKYFLMRFIFTFRSFCKIISADSSPKRNIQDIDKLQPFSKADKAFDAVFFVGVDQIDGEYFVMGSDRRKNGIVNGLFYLITKEHGMLMSEKLPSTDMKVTPPFHKIDYYGAEGIQIDPKQPMVLWNLKFDGTMRSQSNPDKTFQVKFTGSFTSLTKQYFLYDTDFSHHAMAYSMAKDPWSFQYFKDLKTAHQTHYEQIGHVHASIQINKDKPIKLTYQSFRDHSFGYQRNWCFMHRFAYHILFFENGNALVVCNVSQPCTCSELVIGYFFETYRGLPKMDTPQDFINFNENYGSRNLCSYVPIRSSDFQLYQHGEGGNPPLDYAFSVVVGAAESVIQIKVVNYAIHYYGENKEAKIYERFLTCTMNGIPGHGTSEFSYNNYDLHRTGHS